MSGKVVCAAIRNRHGNIILGVRHFDALMHQQIRARDDCETWRAAEQGFVDASGMWLSRENAMIRAKACGQQIDIKQGCGGDPHTLYSEGLY